MNSLLVLLGLWLLIPKPSHAVHNDPHMILVERILQRIKDCPAILPEFDLQRGVVVSEGDDQKFHLAFHYQHGVHERVDPHADALKKSSKTIREFSEESGGIDLWLQFFTGSWQGQQDINPMAFGDLQVAVEVKTNRDWMREAILAAVATEKYIFDYPRLESLPQETQQEKAQVMVIGTYWEGTYPCIQGPNGEREMIQAHGFSVSHVYQGVVRCRSFDVNTFDWKPSSSLQPFRPYLVLLNPSTHSLALLADPEAVWSMWTAMGPKEIIAIHGIDEGKRPMD